MKVRVAGDGVSISKPAPSLALLRVWHPDAAKLSAKASAIEPIDFSIGLPSLLDEFHGFLKSNGALKRPALLGGGRLEMNFVGKDEDGRGCDRPNADAWKLLEQEG